MVGGWFSLVVFCWAGLFVVLAFCRLVGSFVYFFCSCVFSRFPARLSVLCFHLFSLVLGVPFPSSAYLFVFLFFVRLWAWWGSRCCPVLGFLSSSFFCFVHSGVVGLFFAWCGWWVYFCWWRLVFSGSFMIFASWFVPFWYCGLSVFVLLWGSGAFWCLVVFCLWVLFYGMLASLRRLRSFRVVLFFGAVCCLCFLFLFR